MPECAKHYRAMPECAKIGGRHLRCDACNVVEMCIGRGERDASKQPSNQVAVGDDGTGLSRIKIPGNRSLHSLDCRLPGRWDFCWRHDLVHHSKDELSLAAVCEGVRL